MKNGWFSGSNCLFTRGYIPEIGGEHVQMHTSLTSENVPVKGRSYPATFTQPFSNGHHIIIYLQLEYEFFSNPGAIAMENHMENHDSIEKFHEDPGFRHDQPHSISEDVCITVSQIWTSMRTKKNHIYARLGSKHGISGCENGPSVP